MEIKDTEEMGDRVTYIVEPANSVVSHRRLEPAGSILSSRWPHSRKTIDAFASSDNQNTNKPSKSLPCCSRIHATGLAVDGTPQLPLRAWLTSRDASSQPDFPAMSDGRRDLFF